MQGRVNGQDYELSLEVGLGQELRFEDVKCCLGLQVLDEGGTKVSFLHDT